MVVDGECKDVTSCLIDDTETMPLSGGDLSDGEGNFRATNEATLAVHSTAIGYAEKRK